MVALDEVVVFGGESFALGGAGGAVDGDVFLNEFSVEVDGEELGFFEDGAVFGEAGGAEFDEEFLPLAGWVGGVGFRGVTLVAFRFLFVIPAVVDGAHVAIGGFGFAVAVEDLHFVAALEVDAGVRAFWDEEFGFDGAVAEFFDGGEVACFFGRSGVGEEEGFSVELDFDGFSIRVGGGGALPALGGF